MAQFLSDAWISDLDEAARAAVAPLELRLVVQQNVVGDEGLEISYVMQIGNGKVTVRAGHDDHADITLTQDRATAAAIARGELSAQTAFMSGRLRLGGDLRSVIDRSQELATMADIFAAARDATTW